MPSCEYHCPGCSAVLKTADPLPAGRLIRCPRCDTSFPVPASDSTVVGGGPARGPQVRERPIDDWTDTEHPDYQAMHRSRRRPQPKSKLPLIAGVMLGTLLLGAAGFAVYWFAFRDPGLGSAAEPMKQAIGYLPLENEASVLGGLDVESLLADATVTRLLDKYRAPDGQDFRTMFQNHTGLELNQLKYLVVSVQVPREADNGKAAMPRFTLVAETRVPYDRGRILKAIPATNDGPRTLEGKEFHEVALEGESFKLTFPAPRFLVVSNLPDEDFKAVLRLDGSRTTLPDHLTAMLRKMDRSHLWVAGSAAGSELAQAGKGGFIPDKAFDLVKIMLPFEGAQALGLWFEVKEQRLKAHFGMLCKDATTAEQAANRLDLALNGFRGEMNRVQPVPDARKLPQAPLQDILKSVTVAAEGELLTISAQVPLDEIEKLIDESLQPPARKSNPQQGIAPPVNP
jgi:hypothetical protein